MVSEGMVWGTAVTTRLETLENVSPEKQKDLK